MALARFSGPSPTDARVIVARLVQADVASRHTRTPGLCAADCEARRHVSGRGLNARLRSGRLLQNVSDVMRQRNVLRSRSGNQRLDEVER